MDRATDITSGIRARAHVAARVRARARVRTRRSAGFTLVEMLAALAILVLASMIVATGVPTAQRAYVSAVDASNAQVLLSTTTTRLRDELSVADPATVKGFSGAPTLEDGELLYGSFESLETGYATSVKYSDDMGLFVTEERAGGNESTSTRLVPAKASAGANANLLTLVDSMTYDSATGMFTVENLRVVRSDGTELADAGVEKLEIRALGAVQAGSASSGS